MPQMNPMWWFSLFIIFIATLTISNSLNYFYKKNSISLSSSSKILKNQINWKW